MDDVRQGVDGRTVAIGIVHEDDQMAVKVRPQFELLFNVLNGFAGRFSGPVGIAGIVGAWLPAREAASVSPAQALKAGDEAALLGGRGHPALGLAMLAASLIACLIPAMDGLPVGGYLSIACLLAGSVMLLPAIASVIARSLPERGPVPARLAAARLGAAPGHAVVAAAGVLTSVALAAAMAMMVASFRNSVDQWLTQVLPADLYLRTGDVRSGSLLDEALQARIVATPGVARVSLTRHDSLRLNIGKAPAALLARPVSADGHELPLVGRARPSVAGGDPAIWISEAMQDLYGWALRIRFDDALHEY